MLPCNAPDGIRVAFDEPRLVANSGLMLQVTLLGVWALASLRTATLPLATPRVGRLSTTSG